MPGGYVLYNKNAGTKKDASFLQELKEKMSIPLKYIDIKRIKNYPVFLSNMTADDVIILCGGDGTLSRFINHIHGISFQCEVLYYPCGTGDDFAHELGYNGHSDPFSITECIQKLPVVTVNGREHRFINSVGYGIDGYCCEMRDKQGATWHKPVNYLALAVRSLLFHYRPTSAKITVDGITHIYKKVWLAPTMLGKYYGGGMMPTPAQERSSGTLSTLVFHDVGRLRALMIFPSLFKGKHTRHTKNIEILQGHHIHVAFDRPTALQIDGETIPDVTSYTAHYSTERILTSI